MQYFKKFPIFVSIMVVLLLAFVAGAVYDGFIFFADGNKSEKKLKNARANFEDAIAQDPSQKSIDKAKANIKKLEERLAFLEKDLTRAHGDIFTVAPAEPYQLVEHLRGKVLSWKRVAGKKDIKIAQDMQFGYKRYVEPNAEPPVEAAVAPIWKQACVLDYINKKLFDCKTEQSPMAIVSVQREVLQAEGAKKVASNKKLSRRERMMLARQASKIDNKGDNFVIDPNITARKPGSLDTIAFRFTFAGHTDILRRFLNTLKDFDAMLVVRSIDVKPADKNVNDILQRKIEDVELEGLDDVFGTSKKKEESDQQQEQSAEEEKIKTPVVTDNLSEFSVVIEYVEVVKEPEVKKTKNKEQ